jgi:hypothetical protein
MCISPPEVELQRILEEHREISELLSRISILLRERTGSVEEVGQLLGEFGDQLIKHFTREESDGYFTELLTHAPRLIHRANELMAQHPKMASYALKLSHPSPVGSEEWWTETDRRFRAFAEELLAHERAENSLLQEAYTHDVEAAD